MSLLSVSKVAISKPIDALSGLLSSAIILPVNQMISLVKYLIQTITWDDVKAAIALWILTYKACAVKKVPYQEVSKAIDDLDHQTLKKAIYLDTNAKNIINHINERGLNLPQQAANKGNFQAVEIMLNGVHNSMMATMQDMIQNPTHIMDIVLHLTGVDNSVFIENRKIFEGLTDQQINQKILTGVHAGETLLHIEAQSFSTMQDLMVIEQTVQKGGDVTSKDKNGNNALVHALQNTQQRVKAINVVKAFTADGKYFVEVALPIVTDLNQAELIKPIIEYAKKQDNAQELLKPLVEAAIISENLEVIKQLHKNGVELQDQQILKVSQLIEENLNSENLDFQIKLLRNIDNKEVIKAIENIVTAPELVALCQARELAIDSKFNQNFIQILTKNSIFGYGEQGMNISALADFVQNKTVPIGQKFIAIAASLPNAHTLLCQFLIEKVCDTVDLYSNQSSDAEVEIYENQDVDYIYDLEM